MFQCKLCGENEKAVQDSLCAELERLSFFSETSSDLEAEIVAEINSKYKFVRSSSLAIYLVVQTKNIGEVRLYLENTPLQICRYTDVDVLKSIAIVDADVVVCVARESKHGKRREVKSFA